MLLSLEQSCLDSFFSGLAFFFSLVQSCVLFPSGVVLCPFFLLCCLASFLSFELSRPFFPLSHPSSSFCLERSCILNFFADVLRPTFHLSFFFSFCLVLSCSPFIFLSCSCSELSCALPPSQADLISLLSCLASFHSPELFCVLFGSRAILHRVPSSLEQFRGISWSWDDLTVSGTFLQCLATWIDDADIFLPQHPNFPGYASDISHSCPRAVHLCTWFSRRAYWALFGVDAMHFLYMSWADQHVWGGDESKRIITFYSKIMTQDDDHVPLSGSGSKGLWNYPQ